MGQSIADMRPAPQDHLYASPQTLIENPLNAVFWLLAQATNVNHRKST
jgi:hypothetical protein